MYKMVANARMRNKAESMAGCCFRENCQGISSFGCSEFTQTLKWNGVTSKERLPPGNPADDSETEVMPPWLAWTDSGNQVDGYVNGRIKF